MDLSKFTPDQRKAIQHLDGPLLVCAGAGTGKTFTLTQRIAWALSGDPENGIEPFLNSIDEALVITFTNKAASELKSRFRAGLRSVGKFDDALKVDSAWISTIHGMCSRILREHALELGIDPEFKLAMGSDAEDALLQAINNVMRDESQDDRFQPLFGEYDTFGVRSLVNQMLSEASCQTRGLDAFCLGPAPMSPIAAVREAYDAATYIAENGKGKTQERATLIANQIGDYLANPTSQTLSDFLGSLDTKYMKGNGVNELKEALRASADIEQTNRGRKLMAYAIDLARCVEAEYQAILREQGLIDTSDLIRKTLAAFDAHPSIARQYSSRFKLIMVDEFQDTSQLQIDMIERIAGPSKTHLCTVGDSQQSIYRFQGADVGVYLRHKADMRDDGALTVELQDNFRSHSDVLSFVRAVCGRPGFFVEDFLDLRAGSEGRRYEGSSPRIEVAVTMSERGCTEKAVQEEARLIASRFKTLIDQGHKPSEMVILMGATTRMEAYAKALRDQKIPCMAAGGSKFYESKHVKQCLALVSSLANPYDSVSLFSVLSSDVLPVSSEDLLYLSTYRNPETKFLSRQSFAQAMLYEDHHPQLASPLLAHAMRTLQSAWGKLGKVRPSTLLMETLIDTGWIDRLKTQEEQGQAAIADIMKFVHLVEEAEKDSNFDMCQVASFMQAASQVEKESPGVLSVEGLEAVRLMTIHASKGLEFPIVAVTNCFTSLLDSGTFRKVSENGTIYASLLPKETKLLSTPELANDFSLAHSNDLVEHRAKIIAADTARAEAERRRLFYVAATRATDALIIAMHKTKTKAPSFKELEADLLSSLFPGEEEFPEASGAIHYGGTEPARYTRLNVYKDPQSQSDGPAADYASDKFAQDERFTCEPANQAPRTVVIPEPEKKNELQLSPLQQRRDFFSYSSLSKHEKEDTSKQASENDFSATIISAMKETDAEELSHSGEAMRIDPDKATDFGTALHRTCQWMALTKNHDLQNAVKTANRFAAEYEVKDVERLKEAVCRWQASRIAKMAYSHAICEPEVPFVLAVDEEYLEGEIDLLCSNEDKEHAFVIDYKTGGNDKESKDQVSRKHKLQSQCYALACMQAGYESVELHFVRVERKDPQNANEPQIASYRYDVTEIETLRESISSLRRSEN